MGCHVEEISWGEKMNDNKEIVDLIWNMRSIEYSVFGSPQQKIGDFTQTKLGVF